MNIKTFFIFQLILFSIMEIIEEWSNHQVTRAGHFTYDLIELKSKLGEIVTLTDGKVVGMGELAK